MFLDLYIIPTLIPLFPLFMQGTMTKTVGVLGMSG